MHGWFGRLAGRYSEELFFEGDQAWWNPARYIPTPFHTKLAQQRIALSQYIQQEAVGTRMRRWERPIHDFLMPYLRGAVSRVTGENIIPSEVQHRRDLDTLADMLNYLRDLSQAASDPEHRGRSDIFRSQTTSLPGRNLYMSSRAGEPAPARPCRPRGQELPGWQSAFTAAYWSLIPASPLAGL
ncbi:MAG TPA: hypothetical protein VKT75_20405 [Acidobacteriaceae bacterium]|nr:hypothetical protein [Acidobacteriaceae bacterium]